MAGVGKSCLLLQFTDKRFQPVHDLTIGKSCLLSLWTYISLSVAVDVELNFGCMQYLECKTKFELGYNIMF